MIRSSNFVATSTVLLFGTLLLANAAAQESDVDSSHAAKLQELRDEWNDVRATYSEWSVKEVTRHGLLRDSKLQLTEIDRDMAIALMPTVGFRPLWIDATHIVRSGDSYRNDMESIQHSVLERICAAWDGTLHRVRTLKSASNSKTDPLTYVPKELPHLFSSSTDRRFHTFFFPELNWLSAASGNDHELLVDEVTLDGERCWKVKFKSPSSGTVWLARDRSLLPVRMEVNAATSSKLAIVDSFQFQMIGEGQKRWFPKRVFLLRRSAVNANVNLRFSVRTVEAITDVDDGMFTTVDASATTAMLSSEYQAEQALKQAQVAAQAAAMAAAPALAKPYAGPTFAYSQKQTDPRSWNETIYGASACIAVLVAGWLLIRQRRLRRHHELTSWRKTRNVLFVAVGCICVGLFCIAVVEPQWRLPSAIGLALAVPIAWSLHRKAESNNESNPRYRVRTIAGIVGAALTLTLFAGLAQVPSWGQHGVAIALAGVFGLLWIGLMQCFIRAKRFSLASILCLATCVAMLLSGYQRSTEEIRTRQSMIEAIETDFRASCDYSRVVHGNSKWIQTPGGLRMPRVMAKRFGNAAFVVVNEVHVPSDMFTPNTIRSWCWDHARRITVSGDHERESHFKISADSIRAIPAKTPLVTFRTDGVMDGDAIAAFAKFKNLVQLEFGVAGGQIPSSLTVHRSLALIDITQPRIDRESSSVLARVPDAAMITLVSPEFPAEEVGEESIPSNSITVFGSKLDANAIRWLSQRHRPEIALISCEFAPSLDLSTLDADVIRIVDHEGVPCFGDALLMKLADLQNVGAVELKGTLVTPKGLEEFSQYSMATITSKR